MAYTAIPTKQQWKRDIGLSFGIIGNRKSPFPAMERIGKLLADYHAIPAGPGGAVKRLFVSFQLYRHCEFVMKNRINRDKLGGRLSDRMVDCVRNLRTYVHTTLKADLGTDDAHFADEAVSTFGMPVCAGGQAEDAVSVAHGTMQYYTTDAARAPFKLSFRAGVANRWDYAGPGKGTLRVYDTAGAGDALEYGGSLYALDKRGRLYVSGREGEQTLKHSSFLGGQATLCAGTMRIDAGRVIWLSGRSGHYRPTVLQVVNLLERLRSYAVSLDQVTVYRENFTAEFAGTPFKHFEGCAATELLGRQQWPTGVSPDSMRVG